MTYNELCLQLADVYDRREAAAVVRTVLGEAFGMTLTDICCGKVTQLSADDGRRLEEMMGRLRLGEPVQYVLGTATFGGRQFGVGSGVLIPRPETEGLLRLAAEAARATAAAPAPRILDIGTGSGCLAISLALDTGACVSAWDISPRALAIAGDNARRLGAAVSFALQDALTPPDDRCLWDVIVSNPPYIRRSERSSMHMNVSQHEPHEALFVPDGDPLLFYRAITSYAAHALRPGGTLLFETNTALTADTARLMTSLGLAGAATAADCFGKPRFAWARRREDSSVIQQP